jgi:hypothetical protein
MTNPKMRTPSEDVRNHITVGNAPIQSNPPMIRVVAAAAGTGVRRPGPAVPRSSGGAPTATAPGEGDPGPGGAAGPAEPPAPVEGAAVGGAAVADGDGGAGVADGDGVGRGVGGGVGRGVAFGVGLGVGRGVGFGVGFGVGATMTTDFGFTDARTTVRSPGPLPLVASKRYGHVPGGNVVATLNLTPLR